MTSISESRTLQNVENNAQWPTINFRVVVAFWLDDLRSYKIVNRGNEAKEKLIVISFMIV